jgi:hypothetical protein
MSRVLIALTAAFVLSAASVAFSQSNPSDPSTNTNSSGSVTQPQGKTGPLNTKSVGGAPASSPQSLTWRPGSLNHVFGDTRLRDCKPELKQFTMDTRRSPQRVLDAHLPDKRLQLRVDLRPPSPRARFPPPVAAKAGSMPAHDGLGLDDRENIQDRREPSIQLDQEPAIAVREPDPPLHLAPQDDQTDVGALHFLPQAGSST